MTILTEVLDPFGLVWVLFLFFRNFPLIVGCNPMMHTSILLGGKLRSVSTKLVVACGWFQLLLRQRLTLCLMSLYFGCDEMSCDLLVNYILL